MRVLDEGSKSPLIDESEVENYVPVPINDVIMQIVEGMMKLKHAKSSSSRIMTNDLKAVTQNGSSVSISLENSLQEQMNNINEVKRLIRPSQIQLLLYILFAWRQEASYEFTLNIGDYFKMRGIRRRKENVDRFYEDLNVLSALTINITGKNKNQEYQTMGSILRFNKDKNVIIYLDDWINNLSPKTYTLLNKQFFRYTASQYCNIMISLKLSQLIKVNSKRKIGNFRIKTNTLLNFLGIHNEQIKKQGYSYFHELIDKAFNNLREKEFYEIAFVGISGNYDEFMQTKINYSHQWLYNYYQKLVYK